MIHTPILDHVVKLNKIIIMKKQERMNFLLNYKGKKYKSNTLIGIIWKFITEK